MVMPLEKIQGNRQKGNVEGTLGILGILFPQGPLNSKHPIIGHFPEGRLPEPTWQLSLLVGNVIIFPPQIPHSLRNSLDPELAPSSEQTSFWELPSIPWATGPENVIPVHDIPVGSCY